MEGDNGMANRRRRRLEALRVHRELEYLRSLATAARAKGKKKRNAVRKVEERFEKLQNLRPKKRPGKNRHR